MGTQYNILDERYQTELDIGTFNIGLKGSASIIMSDIGLKVFFRMCNLWNLTGASEQDIKDKAANQDSLYRQIITEYLRYEILDGLIQLHTSMGPYFYEL